MKTHFLALFSPSGLVGEPHETGPRASAENLPSHKPWPKNCCRLSSLFDPKRLR